MFGKRLISIFLIVCAAPVMAAAQIFIELNPEYPEIMEPGISAIQFEAKIPVDMKAFNNVLLEAKKTGTNYADALTEAGYDQSVISTSKHFDKLRQNRAEDFCIQLSEKTDYNCDDPNQFTPIMARELLRYQRLNQFLSARDTR